MKNSLLQNIFILFMLISLNYGTSFLKGFVLDSEDNPIANANVHLINTSIGTVTKENGSFFFENLNQKYFDIKVSHIGYQIYTKNINLDSINTFKIYLTKKPVYLDRIVVTGTRYERHIKDAPVLTHVITNEDIKQSSYTNVKDMIQEILPNVQSVPSNHTGDRVKLDGLDNKYMLFLVDGDKISGEYASNIDLSMLNLANVEKIEIISNSMSTIYGTDAISGVVNIITKKPEERQWFEYAKSSDKLLVDTDFYSIGINRFKLLYNLDFILNSSQGYDLSESPNQFDYTIKSFDNRTAQHRINYFINPKTNVEFFYKRYKSSIYDFKEAPGDDYKVLHNKLKNFKDNSYKIKYKKNISSHSVFMLALNKEVYTKYYYYPYYFNSNPNDITINGAEFVNAILNHENIYFQFNSKINIHNIIIGGERVLNYYSSFNVHNSDGSLEEASIFNGIDQRKKYNQTSFYMHNHIEYSKDNQVSLGVRYSEGINYKDKIIFSISHMIKTDSEYNIRTTFSTGYRLPSLKELYYEFPDHQGPPIYGDSNLLPTTSKNYSLSFDKRTYENDFSVDFSINDIDNYISTEYIVENKGTENEQAMLVYRNYDNVLLNITNINYQRELNNDGKIKFVYNYSDISSDSNEIVELVSKHSFRIKYNQKVLNDLNMILNIRYMGEKFNFDQEEDYLANYDLEDDNIGDNVITALESHWITDLMFVTTREKTFNIKFGIKNVFDYKSPDRFSGTDILNSYDPGRRLFFEVRFKYKKS